MKKAIIAILLMFFLATSVFAIGQSDVQGPGNGTQDVEQGLIAQIEVAEQIKSQTKEQLREQIQQKQNEMEQELTSLSIQNREILRNQNKVRLAVHSLLAMEDLAGGIGQQISAIAREFNNSVRSTINAEEKIKTRSKFTRFFIGGDKNASEGIEQDVIQNQLRIQELKQLKEECTCEQEVTQVLQEQIQNIEQEQVRLQQLAQQEKQSKGLFGWLFK